MADVVMPQLGETVTEGTVTRWFKQVGEEVAEDEPLYEVSTDKVDTEVPSPASGYLAEIRVPEGDTVDVGVILAVLSDAPVTAEAASPAPTPAPAPSAPPAPPAPPPEPAPPPGQEPAPAEPAGDAGLLLSPVVRRLVAESGLDPSSIEGTGVGGRVTRNDVLSVIESGGPAAAAATPPAAPTAPSTPTGQPTPAPAVAPAPPPPAARGGTRDTVVPLNNIRRRTGEHMSLSVATSPHVLTAVEVDFEGVERVRRSERDEWRAGEGFSLTYLPFIARALVDALHDYPHLNATVGDGELVVHNYLDLAIAVDLGFEGLLAPVIRDADTKRLRAIAREIVDLASRARSRQLSPDEVTGGTFTITNPGEYGTLMQVPIINQPQAAILSTDGIRRKPVVVEGPDGSEAIAVHSVGVLAMSWDHRAFDGAYAAAFLARLREIIEGREWQDELA